ncbi:MAG: glycoside hydrolase family 130 protein [Phycisphaerae bacterium]|nr:glycoside hydrolase family 130 protein [Phycisphaerae bacterium]
MTILRSSKNPIISPRDVQPTRNDFEVVCAFNPAVTTYNGKTVILLRVAERPVNNNNELIQTVIYNPVSDSVEIKTFSKNAPGVNYSDSRMVITPEGNFLTSLSHLRLAVSEDGVKFDISQAPCLFPQTFYESYGIEDARITPIENTFYITYVAVSPAGVTTCLASTQDFVTFTRHGIITCPDNKDVVLFPEKIEGRYFMLHRPVTPLFGKYEMWLGQSPDLACWGGHRHLMGVSKNNWDSSRLGAGAPPIKTEHGWLEIYHGVDSGNRYCLGAVLMDSNDPSKILARTNDPILEPIAPYETEGFFGNVVFTCGLTQNNDVLRIYYGVADTSVAVADIPLADIFAGLK